MSQPKDPLEPIQFPESPGSSKTREAPKPVEPVKVPSDQKAPTINPPAS